MSRPFFNKSASQSFRSPPHPLHMHTTLSFLSEKQIERRDRDIMTTLDRYLSQPAGIHELVDALPRNAQRICDHRMWHQEPMDLRSIEKLPQKRSLTYLLLQRRKQLPLISHGDFHETNSAHNLAQRQAQERSRRARPLTPCLTRRLLRPSLLPSPGRLFAPQNFSLRFYGRGNNFALARLEAR